MGNLMEIIARGFSIGDLDAYLKLATGEVNMDTLFGSFFEGLKTFIDNFIAPLFG